MPVSKLAPINKGLSHEGCKMGDSGSLTIHQNYDLFHEESLLDVYDCAQEYDIAFLRGKPLNNSTAEITPRLAF